MPLCLLKVVFAMYSSFSQVIYYSASYFSFPGAGKSVSSHRPVNYLPECRDATAIIAISLKL